MDLSIIIVSWNTASLLRACLAGLPAAVGALDWQTVVVDNASTDGSAGIATRDFPNVLLIRNTANLGFARANNQGIRATDGEYVLLLNSDTVIPQGALAALAGFLGAHPEAGAVGPRLLRPDGTPQPFAFGGDPSPVYLLRRGFSRLALHRYLHDWATGEILGCDWVSGACLMARRAAIEAAGLLDENIFMYFEDADWCLRMRRAGWRVYYDPQISITHIGGQSLRQNPAARRAYQDSLRYFYGKHYGPVARALLGAALLGYNALNGSERGSTATGRN